MSPIYNKGPKTNSFQNATKKKQSVISEVFSDYLSSSSIHGMSYLGAKDRNVIEKTWWIVGLILSATACTYFINKTWTKWVQHPVIVSFAPEHTSIWEIPFPAVTVCPLLKVKESKFNYTEYYSLLFEDERLLNISERNRKKFWDISFICPDMDLQGQENITNGDIVSTIKMVSPTLEETLANIIWPNYAIKGFVAEQITSEGLCFTANALGHYDMYTEQLNEGVRFIEHVNWTNVDTNWSIDNGFSTNGESFYPVRTAQAGIDYSLFFLLTSAVEDKSRFCGEYIAGYKMALHNPAEIPKLSENYFLVPANQKVIVAVTPKVIRTSKDLVHIPAHTRNCYFSHEKKLRFFKIYTEYNCKIECLSNVTWQHCGCLPFYLPRDNNTKICGYGKIDCLRRAKDFRYENKHGIEESETTEYKIVKQCGCLTSCNYVDYEVDISQAEYIHDNEQYLYLWNRENSKVTFMNIFFKESKFLSLERNELYGQTDFIANIGGLLGLCMGFSFLSLLEIIYFITLRVWSKIYRKNKTNIAHNSKTRIGWLD